MQQTESLTPREKLTYGLIGIILLGGAVVIGRKLILKSKANSEEQKAYEGGSSAAIAKQIKMAFENDGWWGTDKNALRQAIRDVSSKEVFVQVMTSYNRLYNRTLMRDMQDELKSTEFNEIIAIIVAKPDKVTNADAYQIGYEQYLSWAKRLNAAFNIYYGPFPGTDEDAIKAVFLEIPSKAAYQQVEAVYMQTYGTGLSAELMSELEFWEYGSMMKIITDKP
ncbi:hypothetical protein ACE38W_00925 [Chitinophaga sp. Hz27]|uniref:hypothetical protein n=1 Tax=Chitinophaga sp. Hz27 TaxID=3347169 RepID=UPI0035DA9EDD